MDRPSVRPLRKGVHLRTHRGSKAWERERARELEIAKCVHSDLRRGEREAKREEEKLSDGKDADPLLLLLAEAVAIVSSSSKRGVCGVWVCVQ